VLRGGKALPLYARIKAADAPTAIVLPATGVSGRTDPAAAAGPSSAVPPGSVSSNAAQPGAASSAAAPPAGSAAAGPGSSGLREPLRPGDWAWGEFLGSVPRGAAAGFRPHEADAYEVTNILFSSGTTVRAGSCRAAACRVQADTAIASPCPAGCCPVWRLAPRSFELLLSMLCMLRPAPPAAGRAQGHPLDPPQPPEGGGGWLGSPGHPARAGVAQTACCAASSTLHCHAAQKACVRVLCCASAKLSFQPPPCPSPSGGVLAHQPGVDDGPLADLRCPAQRRHHRHVPGALAAAQQLPPSVARPPARPPLARTPTCLPTAHPPTPTCPPPTRPPTHTPPARLLQGAPGGRDFGEFVAAARVNMLGLVPSIVKSWRAGDCLAGLDWSALRCFSSTGEASSADDYHWLSSRVRGYR